MPPPNSFQGGPACVLKQTSGQSIGNATDVFATFDTVLLDTGRLFSPAANTRITVIEPGWYVVGAAVGWSNNTSTRRTFWTMFQNGVVLPIAATLNGSVSSGYCACTIEGPVLLAAGDYIQLDCYQDSTGSAATLQNPILMWAYRMPW